MSFRVDQLSDSFDAPYPFRFFPIPYMGAANDSDARTFFLRIRPTVQVRYPWRQEQLPESATEVYVFIRGQDVTSQAPLEGLVDTETARYGAIGSIR